MAEWYQTHWSRKSHADWQGLYAFSTSAESGSYQQGVAIGKMLGKIEEILLQCDAVGSLMANDVTR